MKRWKTIFPSLRSTPEMVQDLSRYKSKLSRYLRKEYFDDSDRLLSNDVTKQVKYICYIPFYE